MKQLITPSNNYGSTCIFIMLMKIGNNIQGFSRSAADLRSVIIQQEITLCVCQVSTCPPLRPAATWLLSAPLRVVTCLWYVLINTFCSWPTCRPVCLSHCTPLWGLTASHQTNSKWDPSFRGMMGVLHVLQEVLWICEEVLGVLGAILQVFDEVCWVPRWVLDQYGCSFVVTSTPLGPSAD